MANPILVEVTRGDRVESQHRCSVAVCDGDGNMVLAEGDVLSPVYPRSAVKALQALPLIESGGADKLNLTEAEIALTCASHSGEPVHIATVTSTLSKAGLDGTALECGTHWPLSDTASRALAAKGHAPSALHNNCSGKHSGFLCLACTLAVEPKHYVGVAHPVQREVRAALEDVTLHALSADSYAIDGCSIPTYAIPLHSLARGFARFGTGHGLSRIRAAAAGRLREAVAARPDLVAGTGRFDTDVMGVLGKRAFTKSGAEGVFCAALPELGLGIAIKCDEGAKRASEAVLAALIGRFVVMSEEERVALAPRLEPRLKNWNGIEVGRIEVAPSLGRR